VSAIPYALPSAQVPLNKLIITTDTPSLLGRLLCSKLEVLDTLVMRAGKSTDNLILRWGEHPDIRGAGTNRNHNVALIQAIHRAVHIRPALALLLLIAVLASEIPPIQRSDRLLGSQGMFAL
jgi:hypothetical protein